MSEVVRYFVLQDICVCGSLRMIRVTEIVLVRKVRFQFPYNWTAMLSIVQ